MTSLRRLSLRSLRPVDGSPNEPPALSPNETRARLAAVRALRRAREGRYEDARELFAEAAQLDPALDLTIVPTFWSLPRAAHDAAIAAYTQAGRERDAFRLMAVIRRRFRPRLLTVPHAMPHLRAVDEAP